jgi:hypothetical protein
MLVWDAEILDMFYFPGWSFVNVGRRIIVPKSPLKINNLSTTMNDKYSLDNQNKF